MLARSNSRPKSHSLCRPAVAILSGVALLVLTPAEAPAHLRGAHLSNAGAKQIIGKRVKRVQRGSAQTLFTVPLPDGTRLFTHGPDPKAQLDAKGSHGTEIGPGDPERAPVCAADHFQHVLYGRLTGSADRYSQVKGQIQSSVRRMDAVLNEESFASGGRTADYTILCEAGGGVRVDRFTSPAADFESVVGAAAAAGFDRADVNYSIFFDTLATWYCGIGSYQSDERLSASNLNNQGGGYAISQRDCWDGGTPMHESGHNMGAVQYNAPNGTGSGAHCLDLLDVMCYADGGDRDTGTFNRCLDQIHYDCGGDDYFDSRPEPGEYLASHWNIGSSLNRFIAFGGDPPPIGRIEAEDAGLSGGASVNTNHGAYSGRGFVDGYWNQGAAASFTYDASKQGEASVALRYSNAVAADGRYVDRTLGLYVNGARAATITLPVLADWESWATGSAQVPVHAGPNEISLRYDSTDTGNVNLDFIQVTEIDGGSGGGGGSGGNGSNDPDPATPTLTNGVPVFGVSRRVPHWRFYKLRISPASEALSVTLDGRGCVRWRCRSDLDLYVRSGRRPSRFSYDCRSTSRFSDESCRIEQPDAGYWYIGIRTYAGGPRRYWLRAAG